MIVLSLFVLADLGLLTETIFGVDIVPGFDDQLAKFPKITLTRYREERRIEVRMILAKIFLLLIPVGRERVCPCNRLRFVLCTYRFSSACCRRYWKTLIS